VRIGWVVIASATVSFVLSGWIRARTLERPMPPPQAMFLAHQPPPLNLPSEIGCTQEWDPLQAVAHDGDAPMWTREAVRAQLRESTAAFPEVELVDVDCDEPPCIAWLLWEEGWQDPELAYRWWRLEGMPAAALWTASRTFAVELTDAPDAILQAVSIAPPSTGHEAGATWQRRVEGRVRSRLSTLRQQLEAR